MKKLGVFIIIISGASVLQFCSSSKKTAATSQKVTYVGNVQSLIKTYCSPCHFPPKGSKKPFDNYIAVKADIYEILDRVQKNPGEQKFMPAKHAKLSDSTINVLIKWKDDGLLEK